MTIAFIVRYDPSCSLLSYATPAVTGQAGQLTRCWISTEELSLSVSTTTTTTITTRVESLLCTRYRERCSYPDKLVLSVELQCTVSPMTVGLVEVQLGVMMQRLHVGLTVRRAVMKLI